LPGIQDTENNMPARRSSAPKPAEAAITVRPSRDLLKRIDRWIATQHTPFSRSEAICRLAESGLERPGISSKAEKSSGGAEKAAGMANDMIDSLGDRLATHEDREHRKRRLVKGPSEFREMRANEVSARRKK
jgi:hypothetical protein